MGGSSGSPHHRGTDASATRRRVLPEPDPAGILMSDFRPPQQAERSVAFSDGSRSEGICFFKTPREGRTGWSALPRDLGYLGLPQSTAQVAVLTTLGGRPGARRSRPRGVQVRKHQGPVTAAKSVGAWRPGTRQHNLSKVCDKRWCLLLSPEKVAPV